MTSYPDFICVGAQKAATTWLYDAMRWIPGVFLPAIKELHYFSEIHTEDARRFGPKHRVEQIGHIRAYHGAKTTRTKFEDMVLRQLDHLETDRPDDDWYRGIFGFANDQDICGEICPCYMSMPTRGIRHVMSINPLVRVLVLVRDPVDRVWSHMRMHTKIGSLDFDLDHILSGDVPLGPYMLYTDYANSMRRWKSMAGEGRFKPIVYDRIGVDPQSVLEEILEFIGAPQPITRANLTKSVFSGDKVSLPTELRAKLFTDLKPQYDFLHSIFPDQVETWVERHTMAMS